MNKKFLAKLLIFCMVFTMIPMTAFGADTTKSDANSTYQIEGDASATEITAGGASVTLTANVTYKVTGDTTSKPATNAGAVAFSTEYTGLTVTSAGVVTAEPDAVAGTATITAKATVAGVGEVTKDYTLTVNAAPAVEVGSDGTITGVVIESDLENSTDTDSVYVTGNDTIVINAKTLTTTTLTLDKNMVGSLKTILSSDNAYSKVAIAGPEADVVIDINVLDAVIAVNTNAELVIDAAKAEDVSVAKAVYSVDVYALYNNQKTYFMKEAQEFTVRVIVPNTENLTKVYAYYLNGTELGDALAGCGFTDTTNTFIYVDAKHFSDIALTDTEKSSGSSTTGGGSSSNVSIATKVTGGKVTVTPTRPTRGQTVTITVTPADGYKLDSLKVTDLKGNEIELTKVSDTKYTFVMPAGKVTVTPVFVKIDGSDKEDNTSNVSKRFSDISADAWYAEYINYVAENGLMNGYEDGRFGPNDQTTRAQIVTVLYRLEGEPAVSSSANFSDVSAGGQYYSSAVAWAARNNIVNGYEDGRFGPNDNVTREQIAAILYRYAAYKGYDTSLAGNIASFSDAAKVSSWATDAIAWAVGEGLMNGDNGALKPQGNATRAEIATLLTRFCENIAK